MNRPAAHMDLPKEVATLMATAACAGVEVRPEADCTFSVIRWAMSKHCADLQEVHDFLARMGVHLS